MTRITPKQRAQTLLDNRVLAVLPYVENGTRKDGEHGMHPATVADRVGVSTAAASASLRRLIAEGFVDAGPKPVIVRHNARGPVWRDKAGYFRTVDV